MKKFPFLLILIILSRLVFAGPVDENTARLVAYNFYKARTDISSAEYLSLVYKATSRINGVELVDFYVFNNTAKEGFVIVSGDDNVIPVLAYSLVSSFGAENIPSNVNGWLNWYKNSINAVIQKNILASAEISANWHSLLNGVQQLSTAKTTPNYTVLPMTHTKWNQGQYYDSLCPYDYTNNARSVTGCVATAMAQVMCFWQWPDTAMGFVSYTPQTLNMQGPLSVDFSQSVYQWDSMSCSQAAFMQSPNMSVAKLMYDAGVSVNTDYSSQGSGACAISVNCFVQNTAEYALKTYFKYKSSIQGLNRSSHNSQWTEIIRNELYSGRPVIYIGDGTSAHCFVCDGYIAGFFSFNWGWGGNYNGNYQLGNLDPGANDFSGDQGIIINIMPDTPAYYASGVERLAGNNEISIYPNPASGFINISASSSLISHVYLTDILGNLLVNMNPALSSSFISLALGKLASGVYFIQVITDKGLKTEKISINNK